MGNSESLIKEFKAIPIKCLFNSEDFKIYACNIDSFNYPDIKIGNYGTVTIKGDIQELNLDCEYIIKASEKQDKYGISYQVMNIRIEKPTTMVRARNFLSEILTYQQTTTLLNAYPDIIDRIMNNKPVDLSRTKGIKEYTFNQIKTKVIANFQLAELVDEFSGVFSFSVIKKLYDNYTSVDIIREKLYNKPYECLCQLGGIGFRTADSVLLDIDNKSKELVAQGKPPIIDFQFDLKTSVQRMKACVLYILEENEKSGHTYMSIANLQKQCLSLTPETKDKLAMVITQSDEIYVEKATQRIAKTSTYETEKFIADTLLSAIKNTQIWDIDIEKYRQINGSVLTDEQMKTMEYVCTNTITILQGFGGTGKSFSVLALINLLNDNHKSSILLAPTGRAAKVLNKYTHQSSSTIHRGLQFKPPNEWIYNEKNKLPYDIVILDETSMVDVFVFKRLLQAIDFSRTKLLLIGDNAQIPSVSCGNLFHDILNSEVIPTVYLTKVFRYGKGGVSTVATDIREERFSFKNSLTIQVIGEDKGFNFVPVAPKKVADYVIAMYKKMLANNVALNDILVVIAQNKGEYGTEKINTQIQAEINHNMQEKIVYGETEYRIGDPVIQCVNDYKSVVFDEKTPIEEANCVLIPNGNIGIIKQIINNGLVVDFGDYLIYIAKSKLNNIKLAYAISIHKSQGGQARYVIIVAPNSHIFMLNANLLYVAVTRATEKCYLLSDLNTYARAIKKKENFSRQTWLCDLLKENIK